MGRNPAVSGRGTSEAPAPERVLWVVNSVPHEASVLFGETPQPFGGWVEAAAEGLRSLGVRPLIAHPAPRSHAPADGASARHVALARSNFAAELDRLVVGWSPTVMHVHGTEFPEALEAVRVGRRRGIPTIISVQGLLSVYAHHYMHDIPFPTRYGFTFRDVVRRRNPALERRQFELRGKTEQEALRSADHVVGRTDWDRACVLNINPRANYHHCNETLRAPFYATRWDARHCQEHSIFMSQGAYPIKGLHQALKALALLLTDFPDAHLHVAGPDPTHSHRRLSRIRVGSFGRYIRRLTRQLGLEKHVTYVGLLDSHQVAERLKISNAFIMPSSVENSPNSLGEAMMVGTPAIATFVGGIPSLVGEGSGVALVPASTPYMLAYEIKRIFEDRQAAVLRSELARRRAREVHDPRLNAATLHGIYQDASA